MYFFYVQEISRIYRLFFIHSASPHPSTWGFQFWQECALSPHSGSPLHRKRGEIAQLIPPGKFCQNTENFVCSSNKFPDSKETGYCNISFATNFSFFSMSVLHMKFAQGKFPVREGKHREFVLRIELGP